MINNLIVRFVPNSIRNSDVADRCVVMADILRASSTIVHALVNGAEAIYPQAEIEDSHELAARLGNTAIIGGERNGQILPGFDLGNSPLEYTPENVAGRELVLCTSNGTYTLDHCKPADRVLIGAFINIDAVCNQLFQHDSAMVACAGTNRMVTDEDVLFAGAVAQNLLERNADLQLDDAALIALTRWQAVSNQISNNNPLWKVFTKSHGGRNLVRLQYEHDIQFCAQSNLFDLVPELDLETWRIKPAANL